MKSMPFLLQSVIAMVGLVQSNYVNPSLASWHIIYFDCLNLASSRSSQYTVVVVDFFSKSLNGAITGTVAINGAS